jgi:carbon storage regulator
LIANGYRKQPVCKYLHCNSPDKDSEKIDDCWFDGVAQAVSLDSGGAGARGVCWLGQEVQSMLVITRREGEEVVVGDPSNPIGIVRVAGIKGDRVRLAFEFPRNIEVHRREVADQILSERPSVVGAITPTATAQG